jgi:hypothetical protein
MGVQEHGQEVGASKEVLRNVQEDVRHFNRRLQTGPLRQKDQRHGGKSQACPKLARRRREEH